MTRWFTNSFLSAASLCLAAACLAQDRKDRSEQDSAAAKAVSESKLTLTQAVAAAESAAKGRAVSAMTRLVKDDLKVTVQVWAGDQRVSVPVDLKTGKAGDVSTPKGEAAAPGGDRDKKLAESMASAKVSLSEAIAAAESHSKGKAFRAIAMNEGQNGDVIIHAGVWADGKIVLLRVNGKTKEVTEEKGREERREERRAEHDKKRGKGDAGGNPPASNQP